MHLLAVLLKHKDHTHKTDTMNIIIISSSSMSIIINIIDTCSSREVNVSLLLHVNISGLSISLPS